MNQRFVFLRPTHILQNTFLDTKTDLLLEPAQHLSPSDELFRAFIEINPKTMTHLSAASKELQFQSDTHTHTHTRARFNNTHNVPTLTTTLKSHFIISSMRHKKNPASQYMNIVTKTAITPTSEHRTYDIIWKFVDLRITKLSRVSFHYTIKLHE